MSITTEYTQAIISGEREACRWVKLACIRHEKDLEKSKSESWPYRFDEKKATKVIRFIELLPHVKGIWARNRERLKLEPWQQFIIANLFGWVRKEDGIRRYRYAYICVPRKNAKSTLAAGIGLYMLTEDREPGAEIYSGATTEDQAYKVFAPAQEMAKRLKEELANVYGLSIRAKSLQMPDGGYFVPMIGKPGDGASPHCAIIDEYHEHQSDIQYETMVTGMVARKQPLALVITTAGFDISSPCFSLQQDIQSLLEGALTKDDLFGIIYTIDEGDDWTKKEILRKANPNYNISVYPEQLESEQIYAIEQPRKQVPFKTKHLNLWCSAGITWVNMEWWNRQENKNLTLESFIGQRCYMGLDLSAKHDMTAKVFCFTKEIDGENHYFIFGRYYLPEEETQEPDKRHYQEWINKNYMVATPGNIIDYDFIEEDIKKDSEQFEIAEVGYDPWGATQTAQRLQDNVGLVVTQVPQTTKYLSEPMKMVEALIKAGRLHHDGNPVLAWCVSNVTVQEDRNENIFPRKENKKTKIDGAVAMIIALGRALADEQAKLDAAQIMYF